VGAPAATLRANTPKEQVIGLFRDLRGIASELDLRCCCS
jgi:hypothetical protein